MGRLDIPLNSFEEDVQDEHLLQQHCAEAGVLPLAEHDVGPGGLAMTCHGSCAAGD